MRRDLVPERLFLYQELGFWDALDGRVGGDVAPIGPNEHSFPALLSSMNTDVIGTPVKKWNSKVWSAVLSGSIQHYR